MTATHSAVATLTPTLFHELDGITRTVAGSALEVVRAEDMPDAVARVYYVMGSGYGDARVTDGACMVDMSIIQVANRIDCELVWGWRATRPELDYAKIVREDVYHFAIWHEVGHRLCNLGTWDAFVAGEQSTITWLNEVRADRFAWRKLYPRRALPRNSNGKRDARFIAKTMRKMEPLYPPRRTPPKPLPIDPNLMVPASHVREGIPWAKA